MAGLDCNRSEVVQDCLERLVGKLQALKSYTFLFATLSILSFMS